MGGGVSGLGNLGRGGLKVQEIREEGGSKILAIRRGCVDFFWNNPMSVAFTLHSFRNFKEGYIKV